MTHVPDAVAMTLAGIAYGSPAYIARYVAEAGPTADWSVAWLAAPPDPPDNFAYLAVDRIGNAVLAIRGTYPNPFSPAYWHDGAQDNPLQPMTPWVDDATARIGGGTAIGFDNLCNLVDADGVTLEAAVARLSPGVALTVTGHSLGGTLAPVLALYLAKRSPDRSVGAVSFAGMTPGDAAFARLFDAPGAPPVRRVYNTLDTVAYGWDKVLDTVDFYQPAPQGGVIAQALLEYTAAELVRGGYDYTGVGTAVPLQGAVRPPTISFAFAAYLVEMLHQHLPDTYLALLGAPPLPFTIGFGAIVTEGGAPSPTGSRPVVYL